MIKQSLETRNLFLRRAVSVVISTLWTNSRLKHNHVHFTTLLSYFPKRPSQCKETTRRNGISFKSVLPFYFTRYNLREEQESTLKAGSKNCGKDQRIIFVEHGKKASEIIDFKLSPKSSPWKTFRNCKQRRFSTIEN